MNRTLWIHQFDQFWDSVGSAPIAPLIAQQGFTRVCVKAMDGDNWMSSFDKSADAINGIDALTSWQASFAKQNLAMDVWVVPTKAAMKGYTPEYAAILQVIKGRLILDMEPYEGFWGDESSPDDMLGEFLGSLAEGHGFADNYPLARVGLCYDPRRFDWLATWYNRFAVVMPMMYDVSWLSSLRSVGKPAEPLLATTQRAQDWWTILRDGTAWSEDGRTGFGIFRAPVLGTEYVGTLRGLQ